MRSLVQMGRLGKLSRLGDSTALSSSPEPTPARMAGNNIGYAIGDSRMRATASPAGGLNQRYPITAARDLCSGQLDLPYPNIQGVGGYTVQQVYDNLLADALASDADTLIVLVGTNNLGADVAANVAILADLATEWVESSATRVIHILDECPWNTTTGDEAGHQALRDGIRGLSDPAGGINIVPSWQAITGGNDGITPLSDSYRDTVHFATPGSVRVGRALAASLLTTLPSWDFHGRAVDLERVFVAGSVASNDMASNTSISAGTVTTSMVTYEDEVWMQIVLAGIVGQVNVYRSSSTLPGNWVPDETLFESNLDFILLEGHENLRQMALFGMKQSGGANPHYVSGTGAGDAQHSGSGDDAIDLSYPAGEYRGTLWTPRLKVAADSTQLRPWWLTLNSRTSLACNATILIRRPQSRIVGPFDEGDGFRHVVVTNQSELDAAISDMQDEDRIDLVYNATPYNLDMTDKAPATGVVFAMKEGESQVPLIAELDLNGCENLHFENLKWAATSTLTTTDDQMIVAIDCVGLSFTNVEIDGGATGYYNGSTGLGWSAARFEGCDGVTIKSSHIHHVGWTLRFFSCSNVVIGGTTKEEGNRIEQMQKDGIFFVGQTGAVTVRSNLTGSPLGSPYASNHGDLIQFATSGATAPCGPFTIEDNVFATLGTYAYQGIFSNDEAAVSYAGWYVRRNLVQTRSTLGLVIRSVDGGDVSGNIVMLDPNAANIPDGLPTYGTPILDARSTVTGLSDVTCTNNVSQAYSGMGTSGLTVSGNITITDRDDWVPGIDDFDSLLDFLTVNTPTGYGPLWMQA